MRFLSKQLAVNNLVVCLIALGLAGGCASTKISN